MEELKISSNARGFADIGSMGDASEILKFMIEDSNKFNGNTLNNEKIPDSIIVITIPLYNDVTNNNMNYFLNSFTENTIRTDRYCYGVNSDVRPTYINNIKKLFADFKFNNNDDFTDAIISNKQKYYANANDYIKIYNKPEEYPEIFDDILDKLYPKIFESNKQNTVISYKYILKSDYLIFQSPRFNISFTGTVSKNTKPFVMDYFFNHSGERYELISFIVHSTIVESKFASPNTGHYVTYIKNNRLNAIMKQDIWSICDDGNIYYSITSEMVNQKKDLGYIYLYRNTRLNNKPSDAKQNYGGSDTMIQSVMGGCGFLGMAIFQSYVPIALILCIMILLYIIHVIKTKDTNTNNLITYDNSNNMLTYDNSNNMLTYDNPNNLITYDNPNNLITYSNIPLKIK